MPCRNPGGQSVDQPYCSVYKVRYAAVVFRLPRIMVLRAVDWHIVLYNFFPLAKLEQVDAGAVPLLPAGDGGSNQRLPRRWGRQVFLLQHRVPALLRLQVKGAGSRAVRNTTAACCCYKATHHCSPSSTTRVQTVHEAEGRKFPKPTLPNMVVRHTCCRKVGALAIPLGDAGKLRSLVTLLYIKQVPL